MFSLQIEVVVEVVVVDLLGDLASRSFIDVLFTTLKVVEFSAVVAVIKMEVSVLVDGLLVAGLVVVCIVDVLVPPDVGEADVAGLNVDFGAVVARVLFLVDFDVAEVSFTLGLF